MTRFFVDLDGTLLDARFRVHRLFCDLLGGRAGISFDSFWRLKRAGHSNVKILREILGRSADDTSSFVAQWMALVEAPDYLILDRPFPFASRALELLARHGRVYIVTSRQQQAAADQQADAFGFFRSAEGLWATGGSSDKAGLIRSRLAHTDAGDVLVGDTGRDIECARVLGIQSVAVLSGFRGVECLTSYGPGRICQNVLEFADSL